ncbi:hypothetical protein IE53DRAFT_382815, partial [Violaceomyces palustris]
MAFASIITGSVVAPSRLSLVRASPPSGKTLCRTTLVPSASRSFHSTRRHFSLPPSEKPLAFAFDIDGVLKAGPLVLPQAKRALRILEGENRRRVKIPYVFITNGGGKHEAERAKDLSRELEVLVSLSYILLCSFFAPSFDWFQLGCGVRLAPHSTLSGFKVTPDQVIQAHTVMRSLVPLYHDKPILMIGGPDHPPGAARKVMEGYGFERVYTSHDLHNYAPEAWPFTPLSPEQKEVCRVEDFSKIPFSAVLVFHDSREWGRDIQFITDVLRSEGGVFGTESSPERPPQTQIPLYFSHGDLREFFFSFPFFFQTFLGKFNVHSNVGRSWWIGIEIPGLTPFLVLLHLP